MAENKEKEGLKTRFDFTVYNDDRELKEKLERHAKDEHRSLSGQVLAILKEYLKQVEV